MLMSPPPDLPSWPPTPYAPPGHHSPTASPTAPPRSGPVWAEHLGWTGPFRDAEWARDARLEAERLTSRILMPIYGSIGDSDLDEFAELVETTRNAIDM